MAARSIEIETTKANQFSNISASAIAVANTQQGNKT
jgi:hypothetical protein